MTTRDQALPVGGEELEGVSQKDTRSVPVVELAEASPPDEIFGKQATSSIRQVAALLLRDTSNTMAYDGGNGVPVYAVFR